jgi:hypothetical protein
VYTLPAVEYGTITVGNKKPISPFIYGVNFPTDANYIKTLGVTMSRWGGNAVTAYNPNGDFTNAGADVRMTTLDCVTCAEMTSSGTLRTAWPAPRPRTIGSDGPAVRAARAWLPFLLSTGLPRTPRRTPTRRACSLVSRLGLFLVVDYELTLPSRPEVIRSVHPRCR